jgi:hypothetical protein
MDESLDSGIYEIPDNADENVLNWYTEIDIIESGIKRIRVDDSLIDIVISSNNNVTLLLEYIAEYVRLFC